MKKKSMLVMGIMSFMLMACGMNEGNQTSDEKTFVMGLDDTFAPMGFKDDNGNIVGFDVELAKEVAKRNNYEVIFQNIDWDFKETELNNGTIDCIWNGYSVTEDRKKEVQFSKSYMENRQIVIVLKDSGIKTLTDLKDKVLSVQKNSSAYEAVCKDTAFVETLANKEVIMFDTNNDCFMDLEAGRSDAIVVDETLARYYMKQQDNDIYYVLEENFGTEEYAVGFRKEDNELREMVDTTLEEMKQDGTFDQIKANWFEE